MGEAVKTGGSFTLATVTLSVADPVAPKLSVTVTPKAFNPTLAFVGVPERFPLEAMLSHVGPEILA